MFYYNCCLDFKRFFLQKVMAQHGEEVEFEHESEDQAKAGSLEIRKFPRRDQRAAWESTFLNI